MSHLRLVKTNNSVSNNEPNQAADVVTPLVGEAYQFSALAKDFNKIDGLIGHYKLSIRQSEITPASAKSDSTNHCYFWHSYVTESELTSLHLRHGQQKRFDEQRLKANRAILQSSRLIGPNIVYLDDKATLNVTPEFIIHFNTAAGAAQLAEIRLIDSSRFITLTSGKTIPVICTDPAAGQALFLDELQTGPLKLQNFIQPAKTNETYLIRNSVNQHLPNEFQGEKVECVTVLEHFTSFFMQRLVGSENSIWTPVMEPVSWGWSIRAEHENDQWQLTKKKIMKPTSHHDGLKLPEWKTHVRELSAGEWQSFLYKGDAIEKSTIALRESFELLDQI